MKKHIAWICGWGMWPEALQPVALGRFPAARHTFHAPKRSALADLAEADVLVGWSLGACRLLQEGGDYKKVVLLSPFTGFCFEHGQGGRCRAAQVRWMQRWMQRDRTAAVGDFHKRAGLHSVVCSAEPPWLEEGLEVLLRAPELAALEFARNLPENWLAAVGEADLLLDAGEIAQRIPSCRVVATAGHDPAELLDALYHEI